ncbi:isoprenoid biosynthesis glyoxalase ElbB [Aestuariibacter halophilus]|uniref:Glyoxalase n=1 Tax=Fluctibacter halophilus TaxID=226011 RepID=A0ABS8G8J9_9ALTE|nr:isoprenoid biosynthesis glyoxalase ElbB [Aestuariibacter halophilus]MCC2616907.1 isoprenoid biosynthesis glyoxalase ElbB [Aestuariibacter halophilus]
MKSVAILLSGCGVFDGAEIHESVLTMLNVEKMGAKYQCFAPDLEQMHVINHLTGEVDAGATRNVLVEAARIARGAIQPLAAFDPAEFDALLVPGGFGMAKNLCDFAVAGQDCRVPDSVVNPLKAFAATGKPAGYACIAPALLSQVYGEGIQLTIGNDPETASALQAMGAVHMDCAVDDIVVDEQHNVVTTPAYMLAGSISEAAAGIERWVEAVLTR